MKRNLTVLALQVTCSLLSVSFLTSVAYADELSVYLGSDHGSSQKDLVFEVTGFEDESAGGDPGDAGDGYGVIEKIEIKGKLDGSSDTGDSILDEYLLILMSLIRLVL